MVKQNYINHIALVLDASTSMSSLAPQVVKVADNQIAYLAQRSKELDQETRITVYTFAGTTTCLFYDKDVLRMPTLGALYRPNGNTALIDATMQALGDLGKTPELYGDHAFLTFVITDGEENASRTRPDALSTTIAGLRDNWTVAAFVPHQQGKFEAKKFGFPADNVQVWDTTSRGLSEVGETIRKATDGFMTSRSSGIRGYKNLFRMGDAVANVTSADIAKLDRLHPGQFRMLSVGPIYDGSMISTFVEAETKRSYRLGEAYYQLSKPEKVQPQKSVAILDRKTHHVYTGANARKILGLPDFEVKVAPADHPSLEIFVQSTSVNRKLVGGTRVMIMS